MTRVRFTRRLVVVALALSAPVLADAPIGGPDQQYDNFDSDDRWIVDSHTKLAWERPASYGGLKSIVEARSSCPGRRLPTLKELLTLVDEAPHEEYDTEQGVNLPRAIDRYAFPKTPPTYFWTSSTTSGGDPWVVSFKDGSTQALDPAAGRAYVRCVDDTE